MKATLQVINQMQAAGVIGKYAIGGAVGATFYLEPSATLDIDVFVSLPKAPGASIISLQPIYDYLTAHHCQVAGEYIIIEGWQVQFLPPGDALGEEALTQAIETDVDGVLYSGHDRRTPGGLGPSAWTRQRLLSHPSIYRGRCP